MVVSGARRLNAGCNVSNPTDWRMRSAYHSGSFAMGLSAGVAVNIEPFYSLYEWKSGTHN